MRICTERQSEKEIRPKVSFTKRQPEEEGYIDAERICTERWNKKKICPKVNYTGRQVEEEVYNDSERICTKLQSKEGICTEPERQNREVVCTEPERSYTDPKRHREINTKPQPTYIQPQLQPKAKVKSGERGSRAKKKQRTQIQLQTADRGHKKTP